MDLQPAATALISVKLALDLENTGSVSETKAVLQQLMLQFASCLIDCSSMLEKCDAVHTPKDAELQQLIGHCKSIEKEYSAHVQELANVVTREYGRELAIKKSRLDKVAGGLADGTSWKIGLKVDEDIGSDTMQAGLKVLQQAYVSAIEKRIIEVKEAIVFFLSYSCVTYALAAWNSQIPNWRRIGFRIISHWPGHVI